MIIKFKTRKNIYTAKQLVEYILTDKGNIKDPYESFVLLHNIQTVDPAKIHHEFVANDKYRKQRKGGTALYHDQISLHPKDAKHITNEVLEDLLRKYVELRGVENALVLGKAHLHEKNPHLHVMISANEIRSEKLNRMSRAEFDNLRLHFELYQRGKYPGLSHSIVHTNKPVQLSIDMALEDRHTRSEKAYQYKRRTGKETKKESLKRVLKGIFSAEIPIQKSFKTFLETPELTFYSHQNKPIGVIYQNRKYGFKTLGIEAGIIERIQEMEGRLNELGSIQKRRAKKSKNVQLELKV